MRVLNLATLARCSRTLPYRISWMIVRNYSRPRKEERQRLRAAEAAEESFKSDSDLEPVCEESIRQFEVLKEEVIAEEEDSEMEEGPVFGVFEDSEEPDSPTPFPEYRIPHRFIGVDPRRMDLEDLPHLRTDFDGKRSKLIWTGTECQVCGLQIRREKRTNRESSLNVYASPSIPDDLLRSCPGRKEYPVLWRTRDPYVAIDILGIEDY